MPKQGQLKGGELKGEHVKDNDHDFALDVSDGEEQNSEEEEEGDDDGTRDLTKTQNQKFQNWKADNNTQAQ